MAKLKVGKGKGTNKSKKKKKVVEEITLSSGSEASDSEHSEADSSNSDVMEVDAEPNGNVDCNGDSAEVEVDNDKPAESENKTNDVGEQQKSSELSEEKTTDDNGAVAETKDNAEIINGHQESTNEKKNEESEVKVLPKNEYVPPWNHPDLPDLKARHVWSYQENQAIYQHLYPRVELPKLKHVQHYIAQQKVVATEEDLELDKLSNQLESSNVIELANGIEAIIQPNGDTLVLPPDYKQKIEQRRKQVRKWEEESTYTPPLQSFGRKLNITNVKFGRSVRQPKIVLHKILNVKKEIARIRNSEKSRRNAALKRAERLLQQQQASHMQQRRPIVKDGKIVGYAVQVATNSSVSPNVILPTDYDESEFPELEDWSLLEPEVILIVDNRPIVLNETPVSKARQVVINGKLVTLVPYQAVQDAAKMTPLAPKQKVVVPKLPPAVTLIKDSAKDLYDEVVCEYCSVKLPRSIYNMHLNMRHKEEVQAKAKTQPPEEIRISDDDEDEVYNESDSDSDYAPSGGGKKRKKKKMTKSPKKKVKLQNRPPTQPSIISKPVIVRKPLPALIELNPGQTDDTDPLEDPLAL